MQTIAECDRLFAGLFAGEPPAKIFCTAILVVASGQKPSVEEAAALCSTDHWPNVLAEAGIERHGAAFKLVDEDKLADFNGRKDAARASFHARQQAHVEAHLDALLLRMPSTCNNNSKDNDEAARDGIARFGDAHGVAAAALLQGLRAALWEQESVPETRMLWFLERASLSNAGRSFASDAVELLQTCGYELYSLRGYELYAIGNNEIAWCLRSSYWTSSQVQMLAGAIPSDTSVRPAGRLDIEPEGARLFGWKTATFSLRTKKDGSAWFLGRCCT